MTRYTVAAAQYPVGQPSSWADYEDKMDAWVRTAAEGGAALAVFPEYGSMELAALDPATMGSLSGSLAFVASLESRVDDLHAALASEYGLHILAATMPARASEERFVNRARLFSPSGKKGVQDKLVMTRFEREHWGVSGGTELTLFCTSLGKIGIATCYDSEFPLIARALAEGGMNLLLVPSCTDTVKGYWRVRIGAQARALENQCYAVHAPTVGWAPWSPAVDENHGAAGVYAPADLGFPDDGVVARGVMDDAQWLFADIDLQRVEAVRKDGAVFTQAHWSEQPGATPLPVVNCIDLT